MAGDALVSGSDRQAASAVLAVAGPCGGQCLDPADSRPQGQTDGPWGHPAASERRAERQNHLLLLLVCREGGEPLPGGSWLGPGAGVRVRAGRGGGPSVPQRAVAASVSSECAARGGHGHRVGCLSLLGGAAGAGGDGQGRAAGGGRGHAAARSAVPGSGPQTAAAGVWWGWGWG